MYHATEACFAARTDFRRCVTLAWSPLARAGDLNTEMQQMFNDIGAMSSTTGPSAYKGQSMNLVHGWRHAGQDAYPQLSTVQPFHAEREVVVWRD